MSPNQQLNSAGVANTSVPGPSGSLGSLIHFLNSLQLCALDCLLHDLHAWNINVLCHLVDLFLNNVFLHFDCVDDMLDVNVHTLLRLSSSLNDRYLNDFLSERNNRGLK